MLLAVVVHGAGCQDQHGAEWVMDKLGEPFNRLYLRRVYTPGRFSEVTAVRYGPIVGYLAGSSLPALPGGGEGRTRGSREHAGLATQWLHCLAVGAAACR